MEFIENWFKTAREVVLRPKEFFSKMPTTGGFGEPFRFALINIIISALIYIGHTIYKLSITQRRDYMEILGFFLGVDDLNGRIIITFILLILLGMICIFVSTAILHLFLNLVGAKKTYEATFRIFAYLSVFNIILSVYVVDNVTTQIISVLIMFYVLYLAITTIMKVHELTLFRTIIAYVLLFSIAIIVTAIIYFTIVAIIAMMI